MTHSCNRKQHITSLKKTRPAAHAMQSCMNAGIDWFLPPRVHTGDLDVRRRARLMVVFAWILISLGIIYGAVFFALNSPISVAVLGVSIATAFTSLYFMHRTGSPVVAGNLLSVAFFGVLAALACRLAGHGAPSLPWYAAVPVVALRTAGRRSAVFWLVLTVLSLVAFYALHCGGYSFPNDLTPRHGALLCALAWIGLIVLVFALACLYETAMAQILRQVHQSEETLKTILESLPVGVILIGKDKTIRLANPAAIAVMGRDCEDEILGHTCDSTFCQPEDGECPILGLGKTVDGAERTLIAKDKTEIPIFKTAVPINVDGEDVLLEAFVDVTERNELNQKLVETSRLAGMADVATGVLHNVGNVLNSVNVSGQLVAEKVKNSRVTGLAKANALIEQHADDLAMFITGDEKGKLLPDYLQGLSTQLHAERDFVLEEIGGLMESVEHIKQIVSMQQSFASTSGVTMPVSLTDLVEDALKTNDASFLKHDVELLREYEELPQVTTDRHKVLQILVNLIGNAKQALAASQSNERRLTLRVVRSCEDRVAVEVEDNGIGISSDNLERIFQHGFTTKKEGHGFGLHSSALAAKELGGTLSVRSDGPGKGATFKLELPLDDSASERPALPVDHSVAV